MKIIFNWNEMRKVTFYFTKFNNGAFIGYSFTEIFSLKSEYNKDIDTSLNNGNNVITIIFLDITSSQMPFKLWANSNLWLFSGMRHNTFV